MTTEEEAWAKRTLDKQSDMILKAIRDLAAPITLTKIERHLGVTGYSFEHQHVTGSLLNLLHRGLLTLKNGGGAGRKVVTVDDVFMVNETPWPR